MNKITLEADHNTLLLWFLKSFPDLVESMKDTAHNFDEVENINAYHTEGGIWTHSMMVFKNSQIFSYDNHYSKWVALLHDIGKPLSREEVPERKIARFLGHEGVSAFMVVDVLNKTNMSVEDKLHIFKIVALHGILFHFIKADGTIKLDILKTYKGNKKVLEDVVLQVRNDSIGRFFDPETVKDNDPSFTKMLPEHFVDVVSQIEDVETTDYESTLTILVGPPCSRKSTWLKDNLDGATVISRDAILQEVGRKYGKYTYSEAWKFLRENPDIDKEEVNQVLDAAVQASRRAKEDVIIDMTNMSKKSRRKWINIFNNGYNIKAVVFITGFEAQLKCNKIREAEEGKRISKDVTLQMCKRFSLPMYGEGFSAIDYIWND